jgi:nitroreductase
MSANPAPTLHPIDNLLASRWSPRALSTQAVSPEQIHSLLEAARWAPSSSNIQPWRFLVWDRNADAAAYDRAFACLVPFNQSWVGGSPVLLAACANTLNSKGELNRSAVYDTGAAAFALTLQAHALGLAAHQMGGFDGALLRSTFAIPAEIEIMAMIAVGHHGDVQQLSDALRQREQAPRARLPLGEIAFAGAWGEPV